MGMSIGFFAKCKKNFFTYFFRSLPHFWLFIQTYSQLFIFHFVLKSSENAEFGFLQVLHFQLAKLKKCPHSRAYHLYNLHNDIFHHSLVTTGGQMCVSRVLYNLYNDIFHHSFVAFHFNILAY